MDCHICYDVLQLLPKCFCLAPAVPVRLVGGVRKHNSLSGRVEVWSNGAWGTVCHHLWDLSDATVVCHQLGYQYVFSAPHSSAFGRGTGPVWLDNVACTGN